MVQPLHISDSLTNLIKISEIKIPQLTLSRCLEKMSTMHDSARKASLDKDQEQEFIYLHRYFMLLNIASKFTEYTKGSIKYSQNYSTAQNNLKKYELLQNILINRYNGNKEKDIIEIRNNISVKSISPTKEKSMKELTNSIAAGKLNKTFINSEDLYIILSTKNNIESYLLIDARSSHDFKESHLNVPNIINVPEEIIQPGMSASKISSQLDENSKQQWQKRGSFEKLIIFDWNSFEHSLKQNSKLFRLKEAMTKWDPVTLYKNPPIILEGGYEDILEKYPHMTTNPKVMRSLINIMSNSLSLDSFDYPLQEIELEEEKKVPIKISQASLGPSSKELIDRSTKPVLVTPTPTTKVPDATEVEPNNESDISIPQEINENSLTTLEEDISLPEIKDASDKEKSVDEQSKSSSDHKLLLNELRKIKPSADASESAKVVEVEDKIKPELLGKDHRPSSEKKMLDGTYKIPLKKDDGPSASILKRSSSSPNIAKLVEDDGILRIPSYTRSNKPMVYAEKADLTYGKTVAGLTGLKNFANNCYMNSILQCLSNTESLVKELISINRKVATNGQSKTKGRVAQEVVTAFRNMWSGDVRVYSIKDLKTLLGGLKEIFQGSGHQDSNEFLMILLEYLHEDLNIPASVDSRLDGAKEETGEKAWGEFRRKNCSVIQRLFYGQHRSTVTCSTCQHQSITFEQFFNLFVPLPSKDVVSLSDCLQLYMAGERISGWKCPKCNAERNATKKFDISRLPPVLVIALKRFTHEEDSWLQKKENLVTYPLEDLDMERFTIKGSEQRYKRYNLYALSTHSGTLRAGHYKAICRNHITNKWYLFDDQTIEALPVHSVQNNPEVYVLFYNAVHENC